MYIKTGDKTYPCRDYRAGEESVRFILDGAAPEELGETVQLCGEDGFVMAEQRLADWLRWEMQGGALVLTNTPVPEPAPEPEPLPGPGPAPGPTVEEQIAALKAELSATDYQVIKCSEYQAAGLDAPYDIVQLHARRQEIRDQINVLEAAVDNAAGEMEDQGNE